MNSVLPDMQKTKEGFPKIAINKVGVRGVQVPMHIRTKEGSLQETLVSVSSYCNLVEDVKGINMSRVSRAILDCLSDSHDGIYDLSHFAQKLQKAHETDDIYIKASFDYLVQRESPVTKIAFKEPVQVTLESVLKGEDIQNTITVKVAGMSLCPCSKEMSMLKYALTEEETNHIKDHSRSLWEKVSASGYGAHNQLSILEITVTLAKDLEKKLWIEDIVDIANQSFSSPVFSVLKREDEQWVTEKSYSNPRFVEDIARIAAEQLNGHLDKEIDDFVIVCNNQESIHNDIQATAILSAGRKLN